MRLSILSKKVTLIAEVVVIISCLVVFAAAVPVTMLGGMEEESASMCIYMITWITIVKPHCVDTGIYTGLWNAGEPEMSGSQWSYRVCLCGFAELCFVLF